MPGFRFLQFTLGILVLGLASCANQPSEQVSGPTLFLVGDSTMALQPEAKYPEWGWGQAMPDLLELGIELQNHAANGRSAKSFVEEGRWEAVLAELNAGDFVVIGFGHNDQKIEDPSRYADAWTDYRVYLERYVDEVRAKGAHPVLVTSIYRRKFAENGQPEATLGDYPEVTRAVAVERAVPLIDLNTFTRQMLVESGPEVSRSIYMHLPPGVFPGWPDGRQDDTHLQEAGAKLVAKLFVAEVQNQDLPLARWLRELY